MEDSHVRVVESLCGSVWVCQRSLYGVSVGVLEICKQDQYESVVDSIWDQCGFVADSV